MIPVDLYNQHLEQVTDAIRELARRTRQLEAVEIPTPTGSTDLVARSMATSAVTKADSQNTSQSTNVSVALSTGTNAAGTLNLTAAPGSDHSANGILIALTANEAQAFGDACFINSSGKPQLIDADAIATMSAILMVVDGTIASGATGKYMLAGVARDDTWAWTVGALIYGSTTGTTGHTLTQTAPSGTGDVVQILGVATHADRMIFNPQLVQVEHT